MCFLTQSAGVQAQLARITTALAEAKESRGAERGMFGYKATWKEEFNLPWCEAGPPNHLDDKVDSDQKVVNNELSLYTRRRHSWHASQRRSPKPRRAAGPRGACFPPNLRLERQVTSHPPRMK